MASKVFSYHFCFDDKQRIKSHFGTYQSSYNECLSLGSVVAWYIYFIIQLNSTWPFNDELQWFPSFKYTATRSSLKCKRTVTGQQNQLQLQVNPLQTIHLSPFRTAEQDLLLPAPSPGNIVLSQRLVPQSGIICSWLSNRFPESTLKHSLYNLNLCYSDALGFGALLSSPSWRGAI